MASTEPRALSGLSTGRAVRLAARNKTLKGQTAGLAPSYLQANLILLPQRYADDFRRLCARNPVPCPLLAESARPGDACNLISHIAKPVSGRRDGSATTDAPTTLPVAANIDLRHDSPAYRVYTDGELIAGGNDDEYGQKTDIAAEWTSDHVGFLIGCSYSFEDALAAAGLPPRHVVQGRNVPMYRTTVPLMPTGLLPAQQWWSP